MNGIVPYQAIDWPAVPSEEHQGETGTWWWRTLQLPGLRVRLVEDSPGYLADHWCRKGHNVGQNGKPIAADLGSGTAQVLARFEAGSNIDGIEPDGAGGYWVGDHSGKLFRLSASGEKTLLLDASNPDEKIADFACIPRRKLLIVPTFDGNSVATYSLEQP